MRRTAMALALLLAPAAAGAQLPDPSTRALGMGAYTVLARGYEAVAWNPAMLAARGRPGLSIGLPSARLEFGSNSYGLGDFRRHADTYLTDQDKQTLLDKVDSNLVLRTIGGVSPIGLSVGPFAFSIGTTGSVEAGLGKDAVELALFGNAGRAGPGQFFTAAGSGGRGWAATTAAASYAMPFPIPLGRLAVGVTAKKIWGHSLALAEETSSHFQVSPTFDVSAAGQAIYTAYPSGFQVHGIGDLLGSDGSPGSGYGVDLGGELELAGRHLVVGAVIVNALGSMTWKADHFEYQRSMYGALQTAGGTVSDTTIDTTMTTSAEIAADPAARAMRDSLLAHAGFSRFVRAGATMRLAGFTLAGDAQVRLSEGLDRRPAQAASVGAEYVVLGFLPLRAGIGTDFSETFTFSGGLGLRLGPVNLDVSAANVTGSDHPGVIVAGGLGLTF